MVATDKCQYWRPWVAIIGGCEGRREGQATIGLRYAILGIALCIVTHTLGDALPLIDPWHWLLVGRNCCHT